MNEANDCPIETPEMFQKRMQGWFMISLHALAAEVYNNAVAKGFWENEDANFIESVIDCDILTEEQCGRLTDIADKLKNRNDGEMLALIHSEVSEVLEGLRAHNPPDDKIPEFSSAEAELADIVIRIMDIAHKRQWRLGEAIIAKMAFNTTRPHKHGGKAF